MYVFNFRGLVKVSLSILFALFLQQYAIAQTYNIKGKVLDVYDEPLVSVSILANGKVIGKTDKDGKFGLMLVQGAQLTFRLMGHHDAKVTIKSDKELDVVMKSADTQLDEVVVTALGLKREERALGYAATTVSGEQLTDAISANWTDALSGKVAGLNLVRSNSGPTGSNKIILRGETNLSNGEDNAALIVVDGVVINHGSGRRTAGAENAYSAAGDNMPVDYGSSIEDINPDDIENVTVLKGAGASALYGQRGANGAIIITTKSGKINRKGLGVSFNSNSYMETVNRWPDLQFEYGQGSDGNSYYSYQTSEDGARTAGPAYGPRFEGQYFYQYDPKTQTMGKERELWQPYTNQLNNYFEAAKTTVNAISLDGGTDRTTARFSVTNVMNSWIMPNTGYNRNSLALSVNSKVNDKLQITAKVNYGNKWSDNLPGAGYGNQSIMYWYIFWQPNYDLNWLRDYWVNGATGRDINYPFSSYPSNPYAIAYEYLNKSNRNAMVGNVQATYSFSKDLSLQLRTSTDLSFEERSQQRPYDASNRFRRGMYRTQNIYSQESSADFLAQYKKKVNHDLDVSFSVGGSTLSNKYIKDEVRADSLVTPGLYSLANTAGPLSTVPYKSKYQINSFYALATVGYKDFLYMDLTFRQDYNSVLATPTRKENSSFSYPSANVSFIPSTLWQLPKSINLLKLRGSAAGVGSGGSRPYLTAYNYSSPGSYWNGALQNPSVLANPDLRPLRTISYELGMDLRMFKNKLSFDVAVYQGKTVDQILDRVVDRASGYTRAVINAGAVQNKGVEALVNVTPFNKKNGITWKTSVNFTANRNKITELADSSVVLQLGPVGGGQIVAKVGGSMGDVYGRGYVRAPDGQIVYDERTGFALISSDVHYLGNTNPKYKIGFTNDVKYKGFRLNLLFDAQFGAVAHSLMHYKLAEQGKTKNTLPGRYNGIIGNGVIANTDGSYRKNDVLTMDIDEFYRSHYGIDNAEGSTISTDFLKFREARLEYTFSSSRIKKMKMEKLTLGVYGRNLFIWSPWPMFDPEFGTLSGTDIVKGFETGQFPSTRTFGFNLNVSF